MCEVVHHPTSRGLPPHATALPIHPNILDVGDAFAMEATDTSASDSHPWAQGHHHNFAPGTQIERSRRSRAWHALQKATAGRLQYVVLALVLLGVVFVALWLLPGTLVDKRGLTDAEIAREIGAARTVLVQAVAGSALLFGLMFTARTHRASSDGQMTERFSKSIAQLGDQNEDVRIGAIVSLDRLAADSTIDYPRVVQVLETFIRSHAAKVRSDDIPADVQMAMVSLSRRAFASGDKRRLQLRELYLQGVDVEGGSFAWSDFCYSTLTDARLIRCDLKNAEFSFGSFSRGFLSESDLRHASFYHCNLERTFFNGTDCRDVDFSGSNLASADFSDRRDPDGTMFVPAPKLDGACFRGADTANTGFRGSDLRRTEGLTPDQLRVASIDEYTALPPDIARADVTPSKVE